MRPGAWLAAAVWVSLSGCTSTPELDPIGPPKAIIAPEATAALGAFSGIDARGCTIVAADWMEHRLWVLRRGVAQVTPLGREGDGPGEFRHPRLVALGPDSVVSALDWGRRRLIQYSLEGDLLNDVDLVGGIQKHGPMGRLRALRGGQFLDFWLADAVTGWYLDDAMLDTVPLVGLLQADGQLAETGWGLPTRTPIANAPRLRMLLQSGDIAIARDSLFVLRSVPGTIEVYPLSPLTRVPTRTMRVRRLRESVDPSESGSEVRLGPNGPMVSGGRVVIENTAMALAADGGGRLYVVLRRSKEHDRPDSPWAAEALVVLSPVGRELAAFSLPTRNTRELRIASDGSVILLAHPDDHPKSGFHILIWGPLVPQGVPACDWVGTDRDF